MAGLLLFANLPIFKKLVITRADTGEIVYIKDLSQSDEFYISFIHSVNRTPVEEYYRVSGGKFIVYKTVFESYGAGMPEIDSAKFELKNGRITISDLYIEYNNFSIFIGTIAEHTINFEDKSFPLTELSPPQTLLKFEIKRVTPWKMFLYSITRLGR